jgi:hypothetical protein
MKEVNSFARLPSDFTCLYRPGFPQWTEWGFPRRRLLCAPAEQGGTGTSIGVVVPPPTSAARISVAALSAVDAGGGAAPSSQQQGKAPDAGMPGYGLTPALANQPARGV